MKANLMNNYRRKQQAKAFADKILDEQAFKRCEKCHKERMAEYMGLSEVNAALNALYAIDVIADVLGLGQKRLSRIFAELEKRKEQFNADRADGVVFTKLQKKYARRKIFFEQHEIDSFRKFERVIEEGVIYDPKIKEWRCINDDKI